MQNGHTPGVHGPSSVILKLWPVPKKGIMTVRFLGELKATLTHFAGTRGKERTVACLGAKCPASDHRNKAIWKGYAPIEIARHKERDWYPGVLEITSALGQQFDGRRLTGEIWDLERHPGEFKHEEVVGVFLRVERPAPIDARSWVDTVCFRLFSTNEVIWGAKDPIPARVRLETRPLSPDSTPAQAPENPATQEKPATPPPKATFKTLLMEARAANRLPT